MAKNEGSKKLEQWRGVRTKAEVGLVLGCTGQEVGRLESGAKPSIDRAYVIEHATNGAVMVSDWVDTQTKKEMKQGNKAMIQHQWGETDKDGVQACMRPGCTVRRLASAVPTIWQRTSGGHWRSFTRTKMGPCIGKETP